MEVTVNTDAVCDRNFLQAGKTASQTNDLGFREDRSIPGGADIKDTPAKERSKTSKTSVVASSQSSVKPERTEFNGASERPLKRRNGRKGKLRRRIERKQEMASPENGLLEEVDSSEGEGQYEGKLKKTLEEVRRKWKPHKRDNPSDLGCIDEDKQLEKMRPESPQSKRVADLKKRTLKWTKSSWWVYDGRFDPFQVFEVEHEACLDFEITIKKGEAITKGSSFNDFLDTPDPYVVMRIQGSSNSSKRTSHVDNCTNPIWDETFHFYLDPAKEHNLKITLMDANYTLDETLGEDTFCVNELTNDVPVEHVFKFPGGSKVHARLLLGKNKYPDLRFSLALCKAEKEFLLTRRKKVLVAMQNVLGTKAPDNEKQVPILGILGSGGGFRAMTCLSGAVKALHESGILNCATYIAGLSGSSWYISTLYAHDDFPKVTHTQIQNELRESVTTNWKWQLMKTPSYITSLLAKYKRGQPVSFTDFFGHLLGDVLLKGKKQKKLTDMQRFLKQGITPLPLFTCLHAKRNVSCRSFSEWVEFSPYEIGIAKYGTFMKTEDFGNKFIVGKKIKHFEELPLHFLQGVWGSAFTILFKRLVMEGGKKDIVQIMRESQQIDESVIQDNLNEEKDSGEDSDTDDEDEIIGKDDVTEEEDSLPETEAHEEGNSMFYLAPDTIPEDKEGPNRKYSENHMGKSFDENLLSRSDTSVTKSVDSLSLNETQKEKGKDSKMKKGFSFEFPKKIKNRKISSASDPGVETEYDRHRKLTRQPAVKGTESGKGNDTASGSGNQPWTARRKTQRNHRAEKKAGLWDGLKQNIMTGANILNSRAGRAGEVLNPFRGLSLRHSFPISPFAGEGVLEEDEEVTDELDIGKSCRYEPLDNKAKKLFIVDSGLAFNSPYPLLLRPQRAVDIYLSFDFSQRPGDDHHPFKELLLAENWAVQNKVPFPPIKKQVEEYQKDEQVQECYIFKHPSDNFCPVILHFPLVNNRFRNFKAPGVPRTTDEEKNFADFKIFDDPSNPYNSMNFLYEPLQFDRLSKLVEFNTLLCMDKIKLELEEIIARKKQYAPRAPSMSDVVNTVQRVNNRSMTGARGSLKLKLSAENECQLKRYVRQVMSLDRHPSMDSSGSEYADALEEQPAEHEEGAK